MSVALRPFGARAAARVLDVVALPDGGYAVLTPLGIDLFDAALAARGTILGERAGDRLLAVPGGRFVVHGASGAGLYEGAPGGALARIDVQGGLVRTVVPTASGFLAIGGDLVLVDDAGARTFVAPEGRLACGGAAWRGGAVTCGYDGLAILDARGAIVAQASEPAWRAPVALAGAIAAPAYDEVVVFDGEARVLARLPRRIVDHGLVAFRDGALTMHAEPGGLVLACWALGGGAAVERWRVALPEGAQPTIVAGDHVVVASPSAGVRILDGDGALCAELPIRRWVRDAAPLDGGVVLAAADAPDAPWWRPDAALAVLDHDGAPSLARAVPAGVATADGDQLYVWRTDVQGPEVAPVATEIPLHTPVVIGGERGEIVAPGRFALRGRMPGGHAWRVAPDARWRPRVTRDEAAQLVARLVQRTFDGALPELPERALAYEIADALAQLPPAATVDLHGRALFAPATLDPELRMRSAWGRDAFFDELGEALGTSGRALRAAVKARKLALEPPRQVRGYEYLGTFTTSGALTVSDPCYVGKKSPVPSIALALHVDAHDGLWHVFVHAGGAETTAGTSELVVIHDDGFELFAAERLGTIGVDSGLAGVFDKKCPKLDLDASPDEGTVHGLGALASSGGDGAYPVFAAMRNGRVGKLRLHFQGPEPEVDRTVAAPAAAAKPYRASARFAVGDRIEHAKFGAGAVIAVGGDGKIDVRFADTTRTLVHARG